MRDYSKISPAFWTGQTGRQIKAGGAEAIIVSLYLLTSPHANMLGLYYCPIAYICNDTGLGPQGARKGLDRAIEAHLCAYDALSEVVWVYEMAHYQVDGALKPNDKRVLGIRKDYDRLPKCPFLSDFFDKYKVDFHLENRRGFEAPSKPHRSQEQEQEQEQEQDRTTSCSEVCDQSERNVIMSIPLNIKGSLFDITQEDVNGWAESFPSVDVIEELRKCRQWNIDNPKKRKTKSGIRVHISSWLGKRQDEGPKRKIGSAKKTARQQYMEDVGNLLEDIDEATNNGCPTRLGQAVEPLPGVGPQRDIHRKVGV